MTTAEQRKTMVKAVDSWWTVFFVDPIATRVVPPIARVGWATPVRITLVAHVLGVVAIACLATGWWIAGAILFEVRFVIDCIDGKVARVNGQTSHLGGFVDAYGDRVIVTASFAALAWSVSPGLAVVLAAVYPLAFNIHEVRDRLVDAVGQEKFSERPADGGYRAFMARHRLYPMPTSVDVEHVVIAVGAVVAAVLDSDWVIIVLSTVAAAYYAQQLLRYSVGAVRSAARLDRAS